MLSRTTIKISFTVIIILLTWWFFSHILLYLLISIILSTILRPFTDYVDNIELFGLGIPRILAVFISFLILALIPFLFVLLFVPLISEQITVLRKLNYTEVLTDLQSPIYVIEKFIIRNFQPNQKSGFLIQSLNESLTALINGLEFSDILNYLLQFTGSILIYVVSIGFITFFLLYEKGLAKRTLLKNIPNAYFEVVITTIYKIERLLSNYLLGLVIQVSIMFMLISLGLSIVGVNYALTIAVFVAVINLIPYIGPSIGFIFALLVVFSTKTTDAQVNSFLFYFLQITPVFAIAIALDNLVVQPIIFSKSVKAHPLEIFIAIFAGATLAGPLGMLVAIPTYTILKVSYRELSHGYRQYHIFKLMGRQVSLQKR